MKYTKKREDSYCCQQANYEIYENGLKDIQKLISVIGDIDTRK